MSLSAAQYWMVIPDWFLYFSIFMPIASCVALLGLTFTVRRFALDIEREIAERASRTR